MNIECDSETLAELESAFRFNDAVLRHLTIRRQSAVVEQSLMMKAKEDKDKTGRDRPKRRHHDSDDMNDDDDDDLDDDDDDDDDDIDDDIDTDVEERSSDIKTTKAGSKAGQAEA
jgi:small subunit ribosomal protein S6